MKDATHKRISREAIAIQWTDADSRGKIINTLQESAVEVQVWDTTYDLILRFNDGRTNSVETMSFGDWCVTLENGQLRRYSNERFKLKYQQI